MNKETFNKAIKLNRRINALKEVKKLIDEKDRDDMHYRYLTYANKALPFETSDTVCDWSVISSISSILNKHDAMIRQEIQDEIDKLNKEIEEL